MNKLLINSDLLENTLMGCAPLPPFLIGLCWGVAEAGPPNQCLLSQDGVIVMSQSDESE